MAGTAPFNVAGGRRHSETSKDDLHLMQPRRCFTHGQNRLGDRHIYAAPVNVVWYGLTTWLSTYLFMAHHFDLKSMGTATFLIFMSGFLGEIVAGQTADRWKSRGGSPNTVYRTMMAVGAFITRATIFLVAYVAQPMAVVALRLQLQHRSHELSRGVTRQQAVAVLGNG